MTAPLLAVRDLRTWIDTPAGIVRAVDGITLKIRRGETYALLGESGCGKSMTALSIMRLLPDAGAIVGGEVRLGDLDLTALPEAAMRDVRGGRIAMIFQEPATSLNPVLTVGEQLREVLVRHTRLRRVALRTRILELLDTVRIPDPARRIDEYPFQLSGGLKQRVMIAMAIAAEPDLLIADEPTTALDVTIQAQILDLLRELQAARGMAVLLITHDLGVVAQMAHRVAVMYAGEIVEVAERDDFFRAPRHPYSRKLFASLPEMQPRAGRLAVIPGSVPSLTADIRGCRFAGRCDEAWDLCRTTTPQWLETEDGRGVRCHLYAEAPHTVALRALRTAPQPPRAKRDDPPVARHESRLGGPLLEVRDLKVHFPLRRGLFRRVAGYVQAVDGVSLDVASGTTLGLVGESGCGKTTVGKSILQLIRPTAGSVRFEGRELTELDAKALRASRSQFQIVFQDPYASLNPRMRVIEILEEGMRALDVGAGEAERQARIDELLGEVGLQPEAKYRYPHEFSGGQRQRIAIARALSVDPRLIVCDEPTSALDVSVQAQILNLLQDLQRKKGLAYLFITHNISVVRFLAQEVAVMYLGHIVERGPVEEVLDRPKHPYTRALLSAVPVIDGTSGREIIKLQGDLPSPVEPPSGCHFHPRCPHRMPVCGETYPSERRVGVGQTARCHLYPET